MKKVIVTSLSVLMVFVMAVFNACNTDPCKEISCANSGVCVDGGCKCQVGYEGIHCETVMRDKFLGIFNVNEDGTLSGADQYPLTIEEDASLNVNEVFIKGFNNKYTLPIKAQVRRDTITIPKQIVQGDTIEGWGHIISTNTQAQHYYQHANVTMYYYTRDKFNFTNKFGYPDEGLPSIWNK
jgi:hypothetical protein